MFCPEAAYQILEAGRRIAASDVDAEVSSESKLETYLQPDCLVICLARVGTPTQVVLVTTLGTLDGSNSISEVLGGPMHCMIIPGKLHPMEIEFLSARLIGDGMEDIQNTPDGTSLPVLFPPLKDECSFKECVDSMFNRHQELQNLINSQIVNST